jgi:hypothetical protein
MGIPYRVNSHITDINPLWDCGDDLYIATHAVVQNQTSCLFETGTGIVYGMHRNTGDVYAIDVVNGTASFEFSSVAPPTGSAKPNGLAYDGVNQRMYYCTYQSSPTTLYFWDGTENVAGDLGAVQIADADFYNSKYYYITGPPASDDLYEVVFNADGTILSNTKIADIANGSHGWTFNGDIAIKDGVVYGWGRCSIDGVYEFFTYDLTGGVFNVNATAYQAFSMQLAFGSGGILYGHKSDASGNAYFYEVNITNGDLSNQTLINPDLAYTDCASGMICVPEEETAWGDGPGFPGKNWATYFNYTITCEDDPPAGCETAFAYGNSYATCFIGSPWITTGRWGWTNGTLSTGDYTFYIYAGAGQCDLTKGTLVGTLDVEYDGSTAVVTYNMNTGYTMEETHLYVGNEPLPKDVNGNYTVAPGQYPYIHESLGGATSDTYTVTGLSGDIYVVAHAVVCD